MTRRTGLGAPLLLWMLVGSAAATPAFAANHRIGVGVHHWQTVEDLADDGFEGIDDKGSSWILSYQYAPEGLFTLEADLEYFADGFGGSAEEAISPQVFLLIGHGLYAGAGVGVTYSDEDTSDPYYAARVGWDITLIPHLSVDLHANYRFDDWDLIGDASTDTVTLGAIVRFRL
jgi:hypothetical protein